MKKVREMLGTDLDRVRLFSLTRTTGESVKYRLGADVGGLIRLGSIFAVAGEKSAPPKLEAKPSGPGQPKQPLDKPPTDKKKDG